MCSAPRCLARRGVLLLGGVNGAITLMPHFQCGALEGGFLVVARDVRFLITAALIVLAVVLLVALLSAPPDRRPGRQHPPRSANFSQVYNFRLAGQPKARGDYGGGGEKGPFHGFSPGEIERGGNYALDVLAQPAIEGDATGWRSLGCPEPHQTNICWSYCWGSGGEDRRMDAEDFRAMAERCRELGRVAVRDDVRRQLRQWERDFEAEAEAVEKRSEEARF